MVDVLRSLWRSRQLIRSSVRADFAGRFARSRLGVAWAVLHPLLQSAVLAFVLSGVMAARLQDTADGRYALYLLAGMLAWAPFAELVSRSATMFIDNATLLKKLTCTA